jgi:two-component system cell cycle sensor histidine kinase/response regulator CckA
VSATGQHRILVVDDEAAVRKFVGIVLTMHGFEVILAGSAAEALTLIEAENRPIHLLLTDVSMPGMDGIQLAGEMLRARSQIRVLLMSGYNSALNRAVLSKLPFVAKPFRIEALIDAVREVLAHGSFSGAA